MTDFFSRIGAGDWIKLIGLVFLAGIFYQKVLQIEERQEHIITEISKLSTQEAVEVVVARVDKKSKLIVKNSNSINNLDKRLYLIEHIDK